MKRVLLFASAPLALLLAWAAVGGASPKNTAPATLSKGLLALARACETQRVAPARDFERYLLLGGRQRAAWTIAVRSPDAEQRLALAEQIAQAAQGTLKRVNPALVSKYIGETEKNLDLLFTEAEEQGMILFFDEADALFGRRSEVKDSHDRYANQEVSALSNALSKHRAVVILGTASTDSLDPDVAKRFADRALTPKAKKPGPVPPLPWKQVCWSSPDPTEG